MRLKWGIDQLYFYVVCFVMLITIIVGIISLVQAGIDLLLPVPNSARYEMPKPAPSGYPNSTLPQEIIERELNMQQEQNTIQNKQNSFHTGMTRILGGLAQIIIALPVYLYHWRKIPLLDR